MDLLEAIAWVVANTRADDPTITQSDQEIIDDIREYDDDEVTLWVEAEVIEGGGELEAAYRTVIGASDDEIEDAFGNTGPICPLTSTNVCPADETGCTAC
jgi:hypothetical protein